MVLKRVYHGHGNITLMVIDSRKNFSPNRGTGRRLNTGKYTNTKSVACYLFTASNARAIFIRVLKSNWLCVNYAA